MNTLLLYACCLPGPLARHLQHRHQLLLRVLAVGYLQPLPLGEFREVLLHRTTAREIRPHFALEPSHNALQVRHLREIRAGHADRLAQTGSEFGLRGLLARRRVNGPPRLRKAREEAFDRVREGCHGLPNSLPVAGDHLPRKRRGHRHGDNSLQRGDRDRLFVVRGRPLLTHRITRTAPRRPPPYAASKRGKHDRRQDGGVPS